MARYHGKVGAAYGSTTLAGVAAPFVSISAWALDMTTEKVPVTAFQDANITYVIGLKDVQGTISGFWDDTSDSLFDAADSADGLKMYLYPATTASTIYWYGPAFLDASIQVSATGAVTVSGNFVASGAWGRKP